MDENKTMKILITGNMGYVGPSVIERLRSILPEATLIDVQMMGASGRVFMAGSSNDLQRARTRIDRTLAAIKEG